MNSKVLVVNESGTPLFTDGLGLATKPFGTTVAFSVGTAGLSAAIDVRTAIVGVLHMGTAWTSASIGFTVAPASTDTFKPLYDRGGTLVQIPTPAVSSSYALPEEALMGRYIKLWSQTGGTTVAQTAVRAGTVDLKA